jgi:hypothetical protein
VTAVLLLLVLQQQYLLMQPIQESLQSGEYAPLQEICREYVAVNLEEPLAMRGYYNRHRFCSGLRSRLAPFQVVETQWSAIQVDDERAVQSLNLTLRHLISGQLLSVKLIFFMSQEDSKKGREWRLDYLRGLRM